MPYSSYEVPQEDADYTKPIGQPNSSRWTQPAKDSSTLKSLSIMNTKITVAIVYKTILEGYSYFLHVGGVCLTITRDQAKDLLRQGNFQKGGREIHSYAGGSKDYRAHFNAAA